MPVLSHHPHYFQVAAAFQANSQGVGLFCGDVADCSHSFEYLVTLNYLGRGERYGGTGMLVCLSQQGLP